MERETSILVNCIVFIPFFDILDICASLWLTILQKNAKTIVRQVTDLAIPSLQGMYVLANIAAGNELNKEAVMNVLLPHRVDHIKPSFVVNFLQSKDKQLRVATLWCLLNLIYPKCETSSGRVIRLQNAGVILQVKSMINDPCLDCKVLPS